MKPSREEIAQTADVADWVWLRSHLERGGLIIVAPDLDMVDVGLAVAADETAAVGRWIEARQLIKPTPEQISAWDADQAKRFVMLVVSPYVLIQELPAEQH